MIQVSGPAKIIAGPIFSNIDGKGNKADLLVEFQKGEHLQLICKNYLTNLSAQQLKIGHTVHFKGYLDSYEPGSYFVVVTEIHLTKRSKR